MSANVDCRRTDVIYRKFRPARFYERPYTVQHGFMGTNMANCWKVYGVGARSDHHCGGIDRPEVLGTWGSPTMGCSETTSLIMAKQDKLQTGRSALTSYSNNANYVKLDVQKLTTMFWSSSKCDSVSIEERRHWNNIWMFENCGTISSIWE